MLFIVDRNGREEQWHVGEPYVPGFKTQNVKEIQADCDELEHIYQLLPKIIRGPGRTVQWFGEAAQCIHTVLRHFG